MTAEKLAELKDKIDTAKSDRDKAQGAIEEIEKNWKEEFDCKTAEEVETLIKTYNTQIESLTKKYDSLVEEIEGKVESL